MTRFAEELAVWKFAPSLGRDSDLTRAFLTWAETITNLMNSNEIAWRSLHIGSRSRLFHLRGLNDQRKFPEICSTGRQKATDDFYNTLACIDFQPAFYTIRNRFNLMIFRLRPLPLLHSKSPRLMYWENGFYPRRISLTPSVYLKQHGILRPIKTLDTWYSIVQNRQRQQA